MILLEKIIKLKEELKQLKQIQNGTRPSKPHVQVSR